MAIYYNLAKVFELANSDEVEVKIKITLFVNEMPILIKNLHVTIKNKQYQETLEFAKKIKPSLELMGMTIAYNDLLLVEKWAVKQGKRSEIEATIFNIKNHIEKASKEMNKEYKIYGHNFKP